MSDRMYMGDRVTVVTPTYRPDHAITVALCETIDRHFRMAYRHILIVPRRDVRLFGPLASPDRVVLIAEDLLRPHGFFKLPLPSRLRIPGLIDRRLREQWFKPGVGRITGWLIQQILKLQSAELTQDETLVFIDSDLAFIRDIDRDIFQVDGKVRLHRNAGGLASDHHRRWRETSMALLGLDAAGVAENGYIGNVITWKRSNLVRMLDRIEAVTGADWRTAVAKTGNVSEYMLYGYHAEYALPERGDHHIAPFAGVHSLWVDGADSRTAFLNGLQAHHAAVHIQSTIMSGMAERQRLIAEAVARSTGAAT
ncbi:MAG TPA: DUF6492 family protein [Sphingomonas sp.]|jgi:hypothetical protein|uniref:DUF6492 family protein n=1 Tax=Sphingomonas sp. TaxID=28214 RepID=UPI002EDB244E